MSAYDRPKIIEASHYQMPGGRIPSGRGARSTIQKRLLRVLPAPLIAVVWLALGLLCAAAQDADSHFRRGVEMEQAGDLAAARAAYEKALEAAPGRVDALSNLGMIHLKLGRAPDAIQYLQRALEARPDLTPVRMFLGLARYQSGQFDSAQRELERVLVEAPNHPQALHLLGLCWLRLNRLPEGIDALEKALHANPKNMQAAYSLATAYIGQRQLEKADELLRGPMSSLESAEVRMIRGSLHNAREAYPAAIEELTRAEKINPKLPTVHSQLGYAYMLLGDAERAKREFRAELAIQPNDYNANAYLGWLSLRDRCYNEASKLLRAALEQKPDDTGLLYVMAQVHQAQGRHEEAAGLLEQVVEQRPDYIAAHVVLARSYAKLKRMEYFARERVIIRRLSEEEQRRNLQGGRHYGGTERTLPVFSNSKPAPVEEGR